MFKVDFSQKGQVAENLTLDLMAGLRVVMRPLDAPAFRAASNEARRQYFEVLKAFADAQKEGADMSGFRDMDDPTVRADFLDSLTTVAFAIQGVVEWNVVDQNTGAVVPVTKENIDHIFTHTFGIAEMLQEKYVNPYQQKLLEKNVLTPAPTGTSAGASDTAKAAGKTTRPVAKAKKVMAAKSAPTKNTK